MADLDLVDVIKNVPLFSALSREDVAKVLGKLEETFYSAGTKIFSQGEKGDAFYLIQSGAVQIVLQSPGRNQEVLAALGPKEWFGEMALLSGEPRSATTLAVQDTVAWRLSREAWDELIEKHPSWLLHFCATLSKRLSRIDQQYSHGRDAFTALADEFYNLLAPADQEALRYFSLLKTLDPQVIAFFLKPEKTDEFLATLERSKLPLVRSDSGDLSLHGLFKEFLTEKLLAIEGKEGKQQFLAQLATFYEFMRKWDDALLHRLEAKDWSGASRILMAHQDELIESAPLLVKDALYKIPAEVFLADVSLVQLKSETLMRFGEIKDAIRTYKENFAQQNSDLLGSAEIARFRSLAESWIQKGNYVQAIDCLRQAFNLVEREAAKTKHYPDDDYWNQSRRNEISPPPENLPSEERTSANALLNLSSFYQKSSLSRWIGGIVGLCLCGYLWFGNPDLGLDRAATRQLGLLSITFIYWIFWVLPDYGVALMFALAMILTGLGKPEVVLGGFASTTWFMTLGVLGLGTAITSSGLFYRLSLQLVRFFPLNYSWQIVALGFMGIIVMALIPQQSARTAIISQMLVNLSESLGYKTPSKASTGLFVASFLGLGQLGFLFLTGSTTSLIAWGLLPSEARAQFTWGYWFLAAFPPTLVVIAIILLVSILLYRPESEARVSERMVQNQIEVLGRLSQHEWITLGVLCFTVAGWLTVSYHKIDGAWIALLALCVLINTDALGWGMLKKGIDWEMLVYMGATLSIPTLVTQARIDHWLVHLVSPIILPYVGHPVLTFMIIILMTYLVKLLFTSFLTVVTLTVALLPLSGDLGIHPWVMIMIILVASEVWFFPFQVDWHTLAFSSTEGKGFSYQYMYRIGPFYPLAYIAALLAAIPYWRFLGLIH